MIETYGLEIPEGWNQLRIELACYRYKHLRDWTGLAPEEHLLRAIRSVFTPKEYAIHYWTEWRAWSWCNHEEVGWIGSGSSGKSCDAAMFAYMDFLAGPYETSTTIYSTTKSKLRRRIWKDIIRFHEMAPFGLNYRRADMMITPMQTSDTINFLAGEGILRDDNTVVVSNLFGVHNKRNRIILDEAQGIPWTVIEGSANASLGGELEEGSWKVVLMGNPEDEEETLCRFNAPEGGWLTLDVSDKQWVTKTGGIALHFDGLESPSIKEPGGETKYPFLIRRSNIARLEKRFGKDSIRYMSQVRGWLVRGAQTDRVIDYPTLDQFNVWIKADRRSWARKLAAADPAFSSGGDRCRMCAADLFRDDFNVPILEWTNEEDIPLKATDELPMTYDLVAQMVDFCNRVGAAPHQFGLDITGQQKVLPDVIDREWSPGSFRVDFNGSASKDMFDSELGLTMKDVYFNRVTELWMAFPVYVKCMQIRNLSRETAVEWTARRVTFKGNRQQVEPKDLMRKRVGYSPDRADAQAILIALARARFEYLPNLNRPKPTIDPWAEAYDEADLVEDYASEALE